MLFGGNSLPWFVIVDNNSCIALLSCLIGVRDKDGSIYVNMLQHEEVGVCQLADGSPASDTELVSRLVIPLSVGPMTKFKVLVVAVFMVVEGFLARFPVLTFLPCIYVWYCVAMCYRTKPGRW